MTKRPRILFVEDEETFRLFAGRYLEEREFDVRYAKTAAEAAIALGEGPHPDLVLLDLNLPDGHGLDVLAELDPAQRVLVLTSYGDAQTAVRALKAGALDYLTKPIRLEELLAAVREALAAELPMRTASGVFRRVAPRPASSLVGEHHSWTWVMDRLQRSAERQVPSLLLLGESGTGKTALARQFHTLLGTAGPFVAVDCPTIPEALLESELFGHEKGAFTGATRTKPGQVELADGGTLFLDEIGELPHSLQPKLLRFLEERRFRRVGGVEDKQADVRLVCATNRDLQGDVEAGTFRTDLFYRLDIVSIEVPPLRDRGGDALLLAERFLEQFAAETGAPPLVLGDEARAFLEEHTFPGNVRELRNLMQRAVTFCEGPELHPSDLGARQRPPQVATPNATAAPAPVDLDQVLNLLEAHYVHLALEQAENQRDAGALLGIDRFAVSRRANRLKGFGGDGAVRDQLAALPPWFRPVIGDHPRALPAEGLDLPALRAELQDRAVAAALEQAGSKARAAGLLGMSRGRFGRRLDAQG